MRLSILALAALCLTACASAGPGDGSAPVQSRVWCYQTIGLPDCFAAPLIGEEERLVQEPLPEPVEQPSMWDRATGWM